MLSTSLQTHVHNNGVVAYPTSTLPGLACLPTKDALDALFELKRRSPDKPVSLGSSPSTRRPRWFEFLKRCERWRLRFLAVSSRSSLMRLNRSTLDWAGRELPYGAWLIQPLERWWKPSDPSRPRAPMNPGRRRLPPARRPGPNLDSLPMLSLQVNAPEVLEAPFSMSWKGPTVWR